MKFKNYIFKFHIQYFPANIIKRLVTLIHKNYVWNKKHKYILMLNIIIWLLIFINIKIKSHIIICVFIDITVNFQIKKSIYIKCYRPDHTLITAYLFKLLLFLSLKYSSYLYPHLI